MVKRNYASRNRKTQAKNRAQTGITAWSETERIISVLTFRSPEDTNRWGDDLGDLRTALRTVEQIASPPKEQWSVLVSCGLAETLCLGFLKYTSEMIQYKSPRPARPCPGASELDEQLEFLFDENPPFYFPLCVLYEGLGQAPPAGMRVTLDSTTKTVLDAIRKHWHQMTERVWDEHLQMDKSPSRAMMSSLIQKVLRLDPTFMSIMCTDMGFTLPLLAQGWRFAQINVEQFIHIQALYTYLESLRAMNVNAGVQGSMLSAPNPLDDLHYIGRDEDALGILEQLFEGFDSRTTDPNLERLINLLFDSDISPAEGCVIFTYISCLIGNTINISKKIELKALPGLAKVVYLKGHFWYERFRYFIDMAWKAQRLPYWDKNNKVLIAFMATFESVTSIVDINGDNGEAATLVQGWIESGLFQVLEVAMVALASIEKASMPPEMMTTLDFILAALSLAVYQNRVWALPLLTHFLPRPRLLRELVDWHLNQMNYCHRSPGEPIMLGVCTNQAMDSHIMHRMWLIILMFSGQRFAEGRCSRRECNERGEMRCTACSAVRYCCTDCQKADWHEHREVCGLRAIVGHKEFGLSDLYVDPDDHLSFLAATSGCGSIRLIYPGEATFKRYSKAGGSSKSGEVQMEGVVGGPALK